MERQDTKKLVKDTMAALGDLKHKVATDNTKWIFTLTDTQKIADHLAAANALAEYQVTVGRSGDMYQFIMEYCKASHQPPFENAAYFAVRKLNVAIFTLVTD